MEQQSNVLYLASSVTLGVVPTVEPGGPVMIRRYRIIGTDCVIHEALEPCAGHAVQSSESGRWWGRISSRRLPDELNIMPNRPDELLDLRIAAVSAWRRKLCASAHELIRATYRYTEMVGLPAEGCIEVRSAELARKVDRISRSGSAAAIEKEGCCPTCGRELRWVFGREDNEFCSEQCMLLDPRGVTR